MFNYKTTNKTYNETATLNLRDPETEIELEVEGKPVSITVYGQASQKYQKVMDAMDTKARKQGNKQKTLDERKKESIELLVALSASTENFVDGEGKPVATAEQFRELYNSDDVAWIRDQVTTFLFDSTNFLKA